MDLKKLEKILAENNQPKFRLEQIEKAIFQEGISSFSEISTIPLELRKKLEKDSKVLSFDAQKALVAKDGQSIKALLKLSDGNLIETVLLSPIKNTWSACISCQVGCAMGCKFCATGKMGFKRNLTTEEIIDQILFWCQFLKKKSTTPRPLLEKERGILNNIVYMGMGEPFLNWENVSESIKILTDKKLFGFGSRSISVSTAGISEGIEKMAKEFPQINLAISLHFANDKKRGEFMPINKKDNLEILKKALKKYFEITRRKVFLEYIMLDGINDSADDAKMLADYIYSIGNAHLLHVNLIRYNKVEKTELSSGENVVKNFKPSSKNQTQFFKKELEKYKIRSTIRKSLGEEIQGACGQLAAS